MSRALRISALFACSAVVVLASHRAEAVGGATPPPTPPPTSTGGGGNATPPSGGPHRFLTAADVPDFEWKFDGNFKDSGRFHPRGDMNAWDPDTPSHWGLGKDGAADGAALSHGRLHNPEGAFRREAFTITFDVFPDGCSGTIFSDGTSSPNVGYLHYPSHMTENQIGVSRCDVSRDDKGVITTTAVHLEASFKNRKPDKTQDWVKVTGILKGKAWNNVHLVYDGPNQLLSLFVNGTKTSTPTIGAITVPGEGATTQHPNDVFLGGLRDTGQGHQPQGNVDNFRFYSNALYPITAATQQQHANPAGASQLK